MSKINKTDRDLLTRAVAVLKKMKTNEAIETFNPAFKQFTFDMNYVFEAQTKRVSETSDYETCGTVGCILGTMYLIAKGDGINIDAVGVGNSVKSELFYPKEDEVPSYDKVTPKKAAKVAQHYLDTGKVDWKVR